MQQLAFDLGDHVAGRAVAERGVKTQGCFAQALLGGAEQIVVGDAVAVGKAAGLLFRQVQVGDGELALFRAQLAGRVAVAYSRWFGPWRRS